MVPESPSVCFQCKMCKVCFLTMSEIERHLKTTNHYIRPSPNTNSTKENSTASESSDDKPLNLSSKSAFPPLSTPTRPNDIDLKLSSEDFEYDDDKNVKGKNTLKDAVKLKEVKSAEVATTPKAGFSRKTSEEDSLLIENSVCMKSTTQDDLADVETDTVSSTSSEHPPPTEKNIETPPPLEIGEADVSTQFPLLDEEKSYETCSTTTQNCENKSVDRGKQVKVEKTSVEMVKRKESFSTAQCDDTTQKIEDGPMDVDESEEKTSNEPPLKSSSTPVVATPGEKVNEIEHNNEESSRIINEDCEMPTNENDEPEEPQKEKGQKVKVNSKVAESNPKNNKKQKYRCRHCGEMFTFPVQVHTHMRKVHVTSGGGESTAKPRRRSSANNPTNNNNNDIAKPNVQMYPLRSLYARAKRRTRSMQSDGGSGNIRRNSLGHNNNNNNEERKEKKSTTSRKIICFTCRHCGKKFPLLNQLKIHLHKVHPEKVKKAESTTANGGVRKRKHLASNRLLLASKRRRQTTPLLVQTQNRSTRVSTRSASRSADSEPETVRMSTRRRSSVAKSEKSFVESVSSSRRSSTRKEQDVRGVTVKREPKVELDEEKSIQTEKAQMKRRYNSSSSSSGANRKKILVEEDEPTTDNEEGGEENPEVKPFEVDPGAMSEANEEDTIYNDSDCMIIDTVETILYALTSKRSQTCPNCNKYCKFAGNFKLHLKACMNLDDDLELITEGGEQKAVPSKTDAQDENEQASDVEMEGGVEEENEEEVEKEESESNSDNEDHEGSESSAIPYYQKLEYRRCWECGFIVSKFHNLSRHLKQKHSIKMGTKEMHAKQAEILRLK